MGEPFTLRKLLSKLPADELEKFMDVPLQVQIRDRYGSMEFVDVADEFPNRVQADAAHQQPGRFALVAYGRFGMRQGRLPA